MIRKLVSWLALFTSGAVPATANPADPLVISVCNADAKCVVACSSGLVARPSEVIPVDVQFSKSGTEEFVRRYRATGNMLKTVFVSHSDPDFYCGLTGIADTQAPAPRADWKRSFDTNLAPEPILVVPVHFLPDADGEEL